MPAGIVRCQTRTLSVSETRMLPTIGLKRLSSNSCCSADGQCARGLLAAAVFPAACTAIGGISGPLLFGNLIDTASKTHDITGIAVGYYLGAALMVAGGIIEILRGVRAEGQSLEDIAKPLTAEDDDPPKTAPANA